MSEPDYLTRIYRTTAAIMFVLTAFFAAVGWRKVAGGFFIGALVGIGVLWSIEWVVRRSIAPGAIASRKSLLKYVAIKYPLLAVVVVPVVLAKDLALSLAFVGGLTLPHAVIFFKAIGSLRNDRSDR